MQIQEDRYRKMDTVTERFETLDDYLAEQIQDAEFKAAWDALEPAYQLARLRIQRGLTQAQLAELVGTKQPSIARLESGRTEPKVSFLRKVAEAMGAELVVTVVPAGED